MKIVTPKRKKLNPFAKLAAITTLVGALAFGPQQALPVSAHNTGYAGYGCSGASGDWWDLKNDCYGGQDAVAYPCYWVLIKHWGGVWSSRLENQTWECLYRLY